MIKLELNTDNFLNQNVNHVDESDKIIEVFRKLQKK